jgi:hypothetical protein
MALAWKAGWVHALTSSNLVSSAVAGKEEHRAPDSGCAAFSRLWVSIWVSTRLCRRFRAGVAQPSAARRDVPGTVRAAASSARRSSQVPGCRWTPGVVRPQISHLCAIETQHLHESGDRCDHVVSLKSGDGFGSELAVGEAAGQFVEAEIVAEGVPPKPGQCVTAGLAGVGHHHPDRAPDHEARIGRR